MSLRLDAAHIFRRNLALFSCYVLRRWNFDLWMQEKKVCSRCLLHHDSYDEIGQSPQNRFIHLAAVNRNLEVFPLLPVTGVCFH